MSVIRHEEQAADRSTMASIREAMAKASGPPIAPAGRRAYDELIARTPLPDSVVWSADRMGGVPGGWCRPAGAIPGRAILYLHGGGYVMGSALAYRGLVGQLAMRANVQTFVADYRLAPEHPFPAAFEDAGRALDGLLSAGFDGIAVAGDSAGGGLALALLASRSVRSEIVAAAVFSPWIDLGPRGEPHENADPILSGPELQKAASQYLQGADPGDPRVYAAKGDLSRLPSVRIDVGTDELLLGDALSFEEAAHKAGAHCEVHVWQGMVHVFPTNVALLNAAREALEGVGAFLGHAFSAR